MKTIYYIVIIAALICFAVFLDNVNDEINNKEIITYCKSISNNVVSIERCNFDTGPFYYCGKGNRIYRVETDKHVIWFRKGFWYNDVEITN